MCACAYPVTLHPEGCVVWGDPATPCQPLVGGGVGVTSTSSRGALPLRRVVLPPRCACSGSPLRLLATEVVRIRCHTVRTWPEPCTYVPASSSPRRDRARRLRHSAEAPWQVELGGGPRFAVRPTRRWRRPKASCTARPFARRSVLRGGTVSSRRRGSVPRSSPEQLLPRLAEVP